MITHPAAAVAGEGDVRQRWTAVVVFHPAAKFSGVAGKGDVCQRRAAVIVVHPAALIQGVLPFAFPFSTMKPSRIALVSTPTRLNDMIAVVAVILCYADVAVQVSDIGLPVPLVTAGLRANKATVQGDAALH